MSEVSNNTNQLLPSIEIETGENPTWSIIWLHGLGADGNDFVSIVPELGLAKEPSLRFIFPHAPMMPVTCNNGYVMRAWYDIRDFDRINGQPDEDGILRSRVAIQQLIARENQRGVATEHIFIAGFSQGGAIVYITALTHPDALAGVIALSTYIPAPALLSQHGNSANQHTPIFAAHGTQDPVVPFDLGEQAAQAVKSGRPLIWRSYRMPHSVCIEEIRDIGAWINAIIAGNQPA